MATFPERTVGIWPDDFNAQEREDIKAFVRLHVIDDARNLKEDSILTVRKNHRRS